MLTEALLEGVLGPGPGGGATVVSHSLFCQSTKDL